MLRRKRDITDCIESSLSGSYIDCHDQEVSSLERTLKSLLSEKDTVANALEASKTEFLEKQKHLKSIKNTAALARHEVPRMRAEIMGLREKISHLTIETSQLDRISEREEQKIALLAEKRDRMRAVAADLEKELSHVTARAAGIDKEQHQLDLAIEKYNDTRELLRIIPLPDSEDRRSPAAEILDTDHLTREIDQVADSIKANREKSRALESGIMPLNNTIRQRQEEIRVTGQHLDRLRTELSGKKKELEQLSTGNKACQQEIEGLSQKYDVYARLLEEGAKANEKYSDMVNKINEASNTLQDALVDNSKLELTLRFEDLKINLLTKELENL